MYRIILVVFFFICFTSSLSAVPVQKAARQEVVKNIVKEDTAANIELRKFDNEKLQDYKSDAAFAYDDSASQNKDLISRFWDWIWETINRLMKNEASGTLIGYLLLAILVGLVLFAVLKLVGMDLKFLSSKSREVDVPYEESLDNIHEINFNEEIEKAVNNGNYRLAVRLSYLKALKYLNDTHQINWEPQKTNQVYVDEIKEQNTRANFKSLTQQFEFIWYGEFFLDRERFYELKGDFDNFNRKLS